MNKSVLLILGIALAGAFVYEVESQSIKEKGVKKVYTLNTVFEGISSGAKQEIGIEIIPCPETSIFKDYKYRFCGAVKDDLKTFALKVHQALGDEYEFSMPWRTDYGSTMAIFKVKDDPSLSVSFDYTPKEFLDKDQQIPQEYKGAVSVFVEEDTNENPGT